MKINLFFLILIVLLIVKSLEGRKSDEEKEERRERRRQKQERRRNRQGLFGQVSPEQTEPDFDPDQPQEQPQFDPEQPQEQPFEPPAALFVDQPPIESQPVTPPIKPPAEQVQCAGGTSCVSAKNCPFVTSVGNGLSCLMVSRSGRPTSGICCPSSPNPDSQAEEFPSLPPPLQSTAQELPQARTGRRINPFNLFKLPVITPADVTRAVQKAINFVNGIKNTENILASRQLFAPKKSRENFQSNFFGNDPQVNELSKQGTLSNQITNSLASDFNLDSSQFETISQTLNAPLQIAIRSFPNSVTGTCPVDIDCKNWSSYKYRTADGSCNNLVSTSFGKTLTPFNRLIKPDYEDGFDSPKVSGKGSGQPLPSARQVSVTISPNLDADTDNSPFFTYMLMQWGQFLDHDLTLTATSRSDSGASLKCCDANFESDASLLHPSCFPISIPPRDPFYSQFGGLTSRCMSFVRSAPASRKNCALGLREQMNQLSSFIDGGMVYGNSIDASNGLRSFTNGQLASSNLNGRSFLPESGSSCGMPDARGRKCFKAGDGRINVQPNLVAMHALFMRLHNLIASRLQKLNPSWSDEALFQETRRIVIAILQHITYSEFLPIILGKRLMSVFQLKLTDGEFSSNYDSNIDPGILNSFASAAYRMHTLIPKSITLADANGNEKERVDIAETFNNPSVLFQGNNFDDAINGMALASCSKYDEKHTDGITNHMFKPAGGNFGVDLLSLNIQRGRDHGLPNYNRWRQICNLRTFQDFESMSSVMRPGTVESMQNLYSAAEDVDLYVGGVAEQPLRNALVGPTFACILGEQFRRLKNGDRFWYENGPNEVTSFTPAQLASIKSVTLARVMCDAGGDTQTMQPFAFAQANNDWNVRSDCNGDAIPKLDLTPWINEPVVN